MNPTQEKTVHTRTKLHLFLRYTQNAWFRHKFSAWLNLEYLAPEFVRHQAIEQIEYELFFTVIATKCARLHIHTRSLIDVFSYLMGNYKLICLQHELLNRTH